jgi:hypothetical protein
LAKFERNSTKRNFYFETEGIQAYSWNIVDTPNSARKQCSKYQNSSSHDSQPNIEKNKLITTEVSKTSQIVPISYNTHRGDITNIDFHSSNSGKKWCSKQIHDSSIQRIDIQKCRSHCIQPPLNLPTWITWSIAKCSKSPCYMGLHESITWISPISWQNANISLISRISHAHIICELPNIVSTPRHRSSSRCCEALIKQFSLCTYVIVTTRAQKGPSDWGTPRYWVFVPSRWRAVESTWGFHIDSTWEQQSWQESHEYSWGWWLAHLGRSLPLIFCIHVRSGPIYWGVIYLAKKIIRWWYFTCKHASLF